MRQRDLHHLDDRTGALALGASRSMLLDAAPSPQRELSNGDMRRVVRRGGLGGNLAQHLVEVGGLAEIAIDGGKPHVGHRIEAAQAPP